MAGSVNKVILVGNLGRDPEVRTMQDGNPVVNLSVATSENWRDKNTGERREKTEWHRVVIFNDKLRMLRKNICAKARRFIWKVSFRHVNGQIKAVSRNIRLRSFCKGIVVS